VAHVTRRWCARNEPPQQETLCRLARILFGRQEGPLGLWSGNADLCER
jgi:hypothetical protein